MSTNNPEILELEIPNIDYSLKYCVYVYEEVKELTSAMDHQRKETIYLPAKYIYDEQEEVYLVADLGSRETSLFIQELAFLEIPFFTKHIKYTEYNKLLWQERITSPTMT